MAEVIVGHPTAGFSGYARVAGRGLFFAQGYTELVDLSAAQQTAAAAAGYTVGATPQPPAADPFPMYLTEAEAASALASSTSPLGVAGRAAFGSGVRLVDTTGATVTDQRVTVIRDANGDIDDLILEDIA